jgi:hypothetical protein
MKTQNPAGATVLSPFAGLFLILAALLSSTTVLTAETQASGTLLPVSDSPNRIVWYAPASARKLQPDSTPPTQTSDRVKLSAARNEWESVQLFIRSGDTLSNFQIKCSPLQGPDVSSLPDSSVEFLQLNYLEITKPSDRHSLKGLCPDPLLPMTGPVELKPNFNHGFWMRVFVPKTARAGIYKGTIQLKAAGWETGFPVELTVYDFTLPDRFTCTTAFGFSPGNVFRYHNLETESDKRAVLDKYLDNLAAHHISPYDPTPLDEIKVTWPDIRPPHTTWDDWSGLRIVSNEVHAGKGALLINDDKPDQSITVAYEPLIRIPAKGLRVNAWFRTAIPGHRIQVTLNHFDANRQWMSGRNNDMTLTGSGTWQNIEQLLTDFPAGAEYVRFNARAATWSERGEGLGLVWFDDISIKDADTGEELVKGGDFERKPRTEPVAPLDQLKVKLDFTAWDRAMTRAIDQNHFNSFRVDIPGIGGGTFHEITQPQLLGFTEDTPEYPVLFDSYSRQLNEHLKSKGWLDEAYVYWFDEPSADQYPFVMNGFNKLKKSGPGLSRMLTEQVEPGLLGGPNIWCSITDSYDHARAEERRKHGEKFWWYVCTGPKAPYAGLFIDHPAPEMRIWLWQTFQRNIEGILVWESTYWTSGSAYPDRNHPQDPYADPMSWTSGYSTPDGERLPWGNGDGRFLYPPPPAARGNADKPVLDGPVDSVRWEQLRDGLEDYEYLCMLRSELANQSAKLKAQTREEFSKLLIVPDSISRSLTEFTSDGAPIEAQRQKIAQAIQSIRAQR